MKRVLVVVDPEAPEDSTDLLAVAEELYGVTGFESHAFLPGTATRPRKGAFGVVIEAASVAPYDSAAVAAAMETLHEESRYALILVPATPFGRMIAPRAAMRLKTGLVADVTAVQRGADGEIEMIRPAFSGRMLATVVNRGDGPVMMSVRPGVFRRAGKGTPEPGSTIYRSYGTAEAGQIRLIERRPKPEREDIRNSEILISGGGGVQRNFDDLGELARALGGMVAASRKVVDSGKAPRAIQVGQSGKTVSPRLYIAIGISGSIQHVVGVRNAEFIIAVNSNRHAPICSLADIVVEGDGREFIQRMSKRLHMSHTSTEGGAE
jgi:electron transfer flavoprotein alpha subunit